MFNKNKLIQFFQMPLMIFFFYLSVNLTITALTYHVDPMNGNDLNDGISEASPWKTASRMNTFIFEPGDKILFKRGTTLNLNPGTQHSLHPKGSGVDNNPIILGAYGTGKKPKIYQNGNDTILLLIDQSYWTIENLELYGDKNNPNGREKRGVYIIAEKKDVYGITIKDLVLRDIIGLDNKFGEGSGGIKLWSKNTKADEKKFHQVRIENNRITHVHRSGIEFATSAKKPEFFNVDPTKKWTDIAVRNNILTDIGGDGIAIDGTLNALVEHNVVSRGAQISNTHNAGIWARNAIGTIFQYNEVHGMRLAPGTSDGMAFDIDWYTYDTLFQYNYSHDNAGGFLLLCTNEDPSISDKIRGTVRYNISVNDGFASKSLFTVCFLDGRNIDIYNNTFYIDYKSQGNIFSFYNNPLFNVNLTNNIFHNNTPYTIDFNGNTEFIKGAVFESNLFYGPFANPPADKNAIMDDPLLHLPGIANYPHGYQLTKESPARKKGSIITDNGGKDYWGNPVPSNVLPDRGAHQFTPGQSPPTPPKQQIHYWNFDEGMGKYALDQAGSAHSSITGASYTTGKNGTALSFSGSNAFIDIGYEDLAPPWTICMWVKKEKSSQTEATLMTSSHTLLKLEQYNNTHKVGISKPKGPHYTFNYSAPINQWTHLSFVTTNKKTHLFVDGVLKDSLNISIPGPMKTIGSKDMDAFFGTLDEVKVFNFALNATELKEAMKKDIPPTPAPGERIIPKTKWTLIHVDSEELVAVKRPATHLFDDDKNTFWHTEWSQKAPPHPHEVQIDLGDVYTINELTYLPRQSGSSNGTIKKYAFYISSTPGNWGNPATSGSFIFTGREKKQVRFQSKTGQYIRLVALSETNGNPWTSGAEIGLLKADPSDITPPKITAPPDVLNAEQSSYAGASVNLGKPVVTDDKDPFPLITNSSTGAFPLGETIVTWKALDAGGNMSTATQRVTVVDTTAPNLTAPPDISVEQSSPNGASIELGKYLINDNCDPNPVVTNDKPDIFPPGDTLVTWTATDLSGNTVKDTQWVTVMDTTKPELKANLIRISDSDDDDDDVLYEVRYMVEDSCDVTPDVKAFIKACGKKKPVENGDLLKVEFDKTECQITTQDNRIKISAEKVTLSVTATDASGNVTEAEIVRNTPLEIPDPDNPLKMIRVMSYNINHGLDSKGQLNLEHIASVIKRENPDIVALQEVDQNILHTKGTDHLTFLSQLTGLHGIFGSHPTNNKATSGNAVLSKFPFKLIDTIELKGDKGYFALFTEIDLSYLYGKGSKITFISTQLDNDNEENSKKSIDTIEKYLSSLPVQPAILAGDIGYAPYSDVMGKAKQNWGWDDLGQYLLTFPGDHPTEQYDYILFRGVKDLHLSSIYVPQSLQQSDHKPIISHFNLFTKGMSKSASRMSDLVPIDQTPWNLLSVDSEELKALNGAATHFFDGDTKTFWHTKLSPPGVDQPHRIEIDLGKKYNLHGFSYLPRQHSPRHKDTNQEKHLKSKGTIARYDLYVTNDVSNWGAPIVKGSFGSYYSGKEKKVTFHPRAGRYVKLVSLTEIHHGPLTSGAEFNLLRKKTGPTDNIALYKPVEASSVNAPSVSASFAVDGNPGTRWGSQYSDPQYLIIDLEKAYDIGRVILRWETAYAKEYKLQVSNDGITFSDAYHETKGNGGEDDIELHLAGPYRYIKILGIKRATNWGYSLYEAEVYLPGGGPVTPPKTLGAIIPKPALSNKKPGVFKITKQTNIYVQGRSAPENDEISKIGHYLAQVFNPSTGFNIQVLPTTTAPPTGNIYLTTHGGDPNDGKEGYLLDIKPDGVRLAAHHPQGLFRGIQTIRQLLPPEVELKTVQNSLWEITCGTVKDKPAYEWRGFMFDVCRHIFSIEKVKAYIDLLAYYKMNVFHWHLTEDQGWRPQIDGYPDLMNIGAWRGSPPYGGWYTKKEMKEVVAYAKARYIEVIPEIEMPGHSTAALASYKWLMCDPINYDLNVRESWGVSEFIYCAGKESTFTFLEKVLDEIVEIFPSKIIHLGGDEAPKSRWNQCPHCQAKIKALGLNNSHDLQRWFMNRMAWYLYNVHGRNITGWSEGGVINEGMPPGTQGQFWYYGMTVKQMAEKGYDIVNSHYLKLYLDLSHTLSKMYLYDIKEKTNPAYVHHILGIETPIWTEHVNSDSKLDDRVFPRLVAVAENGWTPDGQKNYQDFLERLTDHLKCLEHMGIQYGGLEK